MTTPRNLEALNKKREEELKLPEIISDKLTFQKFETKTISSMHHNNDLESVSTLKNKQRYHPTEMINHDLKESKEKEIKLKLGSLISLKNQPENRTTDGSDVFLEIIDKIGETKM